jgi:cytochrome c5
MMRAALLLLLALLGGCGKAAPPTVNAEALRPADARLSAVYERSCLLCHGRAGTGAPTTGDTAAWAPRQAKGMDALVASARTGVGGMPAMGSCIDCSDADLRDLIQFMSQQP